MACFAGFGGQSHQLRRKFTNLCEIVRKQKISRNIRPQFAKIVKNDVAYLGEKVYHETRVFDTPKPPGNRR